MKVTLIGSLGLACAVAGCSSESAPAGDGVRIQVARLTLPGVGVACYDLQVSNGVDVVWAQGDPTTTLLGADQDGSGTASGADASTVCSDQYGNGAGSDISYIGTCDASTDADGNPANGVQNTVTLWVDGLYAAGRTRDIGEWRDPCPDGCALNVDCDENQDALVEFNLTVMRDANQGFFDVAVNFDDIFCSAKVDCAKPNGDALELVFDPATGERVPSVAWAFACTDGDPSGDEADTTHLYMEDVVIDCGGTTYAIDPSRGPGNIYQPGDVVPAPIVQAMVFEGRELLTNGGVDADKLYWNVALGLNDAFFVAGAPSCMLRTRATASSGPLADGTTPANTSYPFVDVAVPLNDGAAITCTQHPLNGEAPNAGVATTYTATTPDQSGFASRTFRFEATARDGSLESHPVGDGPEDPEDPVEVDACIGNPCGLDAECADLPYPAPDDATGRTCACPVDYEGDPEVACSAIPPVEVDACIGNPCGSDADCSDLPYPAADDLTGRTCACRDGFEGDAEAGCTPILPPDVDACLGSPCGVDATCADIIGGSDDANGRTCTCPPNHTGDPEVLCTLVPSGVSGLYAFAGATTYRSTDSGTTWQTVTTAGKAGEKQVIGGRMITFDSATDSIVLSADGSDWRTVLDIGPAFSEGSVQEMRYTTALTVGDGQAFLSVRRAFCDWSSFDEPCSNNEWVSWRSDDAGLTWTDVGLVAHGPPTWNHAGTWYAALWFDGSQSDVWVESTDGITFTPSSCYFPGYSEAPNWQLVAGRLMSQQSAILQSDDDGCTWYERSGQPTTPRASNIICDEDGCVGAGVIDGAWRFPPGMNEAQNYIHIFDGDAGVETLAPAIAENGFVNDSNLGRIWSGFHLSGNLFFHDCLRCRTTETRALAIFDFSTNTRRFTSLVDAYIDGGMIELP